MMSTVFEIGNIWGLLSSDEITKQVWILKENKLSNVFLLHLTFTDRTLAPY